ncbi:hypothetical protein CNR22_10880 [Sphingobacteriaceae bacterium]|nr:hypothetical protein CNR22_10880 [Sphingobacteriaceae bacterium]
MNLKILIFLFILSFFGILSAQPVEKIRFKKDQSLIYFFQKGSKTDTLHKNRDNFFYLIVPDSIKKNLSIAVENGQLMATVNDSLVKFNYLPGFKYESFYTAKDVNAGKKAKPEYEYKTMVDGISILPENKISISLINKQTGGLILENVFFYTK